MILKNTQFVVSAIIVMVMVSHGTANCGLDGLSLLQMYYGALAPSVAPPPPPAPAPAPVACPPAVLPYVLPLVMPPAAPAPPPPPPPVKPPVPEFPCPALDLSKCTCGSTPHHPSCLSMIKPCLHAKLLNMKKKLIEKKLAHLLACFAQFNQHLCSHSCN